MSSVVVAGHINWDVTLRVDRLPEADDEAAIRNRSCAGGGSAANVAVGLASLGVDAGLIGSVGNDDHGSQVLESLRVAGVDVEGVVTVSGPTSVKYLLVADSGNVAILGNDGVNEALQPADVDSSWLTGADHLHLTSQRPDTAMTLLEAAIDQEMTVSVDPGRRGPDREFDTLIERADLVFVSAREAAGLFETPEDPYVRDQTVIVTEGEQGATAYTPNGSHYHSGYEVDVVDTSGAGDAFVAGFLDQWLAHQDCPKALAYANACGALASATKGARSRVDPDAIMTLIADKEISGS